VSGAGRTARRSPGTYRVDSGRVLTAPVDSPPAPPRTKLTAGRTCVLAGLYVLQVPWGLVFFPLAAIFAITGIFVPVAIVLIGVGTLPFSAAVRLRARWRVAGPPAGAVGTLTGTVPQ